MAALVFLLIPLLLKAIWTRMFSDMINNPDIPSATPGGFAWPPESKNQWTILFIILNVLTAGYYYFTVYREK
jgi:hypothetical protein